MKAAIPSAVIASLIGAQSTYAAPAFQSEFNHGVEDAGFPNGDPIGSGAYINRTGNGFDLTLASRILVPDMMLH